MLPIYKRIINEKIINLEISACEKGCQYAIANVYNIPPEKVFNWKFEMYENCASECKEEYIKHLRT
jgi:hypothetical protein